MKTANEHGAYEGGSVEELARRGRSYAVISICQCEDGLFRYGLDVMYSYGGFAFPISSSQKGFASASAAEEAGIIELLKRFPKAWENEPQSVHDELWDMKAQIEQNFCQPSLF
jgi:hypothetical protein